MSKAVTVTIPHELGREEARKRIEAGFGDLSRHLGGMGSVTKAWDGDRLSFAFAAMGQAVSGSVDVADRAIRLEVLLPTLLAMMAGKLKGRLQSEGQLLLEKK
ncbi:polyhydroxyalkanoic acid system family protein [Phenylobacterium sp.]|uniref:polyhydroxyalkanoic acid system family protein n=1 Tax=Phenylobacterium sp. TaxID=1871053 RepID=UPI002DF28177|nr:polyhydroxyalkanoic acid system family protein [Phenylobacterium sp.]